MLQLPELPRIIGFGLQRALTISSYVAPNVISEMANLGSELTSLE